MKQNTLRTCCLETANIELSQRLREIDAIIHLIGKRYESCLDKQGNIALLPLLMDCGGSFGVWVSPKYGTILWMKIFNDLCPVYLPVCRLTAKPGSEKIRPSAMRALFLALNTSIDA